MKFNKFNNILIMRQAVAFVSILCFTGACNYRQKPRTTMQSVPSKLIINDKLRNQMQSVPSKLIINDKLRNQMKSVPSKLVINDELRNQMNIYHIDISIKNQRPPLDYLATGRTITALDQKIKAAMQPVKTSNRDEYRSSIQDKYRNLLAAATMIKQDIEEHQNRLANTASLDIYRMFGGQADNETLNEFRAQLQHVPDALETVMLIIEWANRQLANDRLEPNSMSVEVMQQQADKISNEINKQFKDLDAAQRVPDSSIVTRTTEALWQISEATLAEPFTPRPARASNASSGGYQQTQSSVSNRSTPRPARASNASSGGYQQTQSSVSNRIEHEMKQQVRDNGDTGSQETCRICLSGKEETSNGFFGSLANPCNKHYFHVDCLAQEVMAKWTQTSRQVRNEDYIVLADGSRRPVRMADCSPICPICRGDISRFLQG